MHCDKGDPLSRPQPRSQPTWLEDETWRASNGTAGSAPYQALPPTSVGAALRLDTSPNQSRVIPPPSCMYPPVLSEVANNAVPNSHVRSSFHPGLYSRASGLDVISILVKVATRKDSRIQLGVIDLSCALVVCAGDLPDEPIIYCSEGFETLTQYRSDEILGQNCRFLQAPHPQANLHNRQQCFSPDSSVKEQLKIDVGARQETQVEILNYKKSGEPFVNVLSIVPVAWDSDQVKYLVGFMACANRWNS